MESDDRLAEWQRNLTYRMAYGIACDRLSADTYSMGHGSRHRGKPQTPSLLAAVAAEMHADPADEDVRAGVEDAVEGRGPRW